MAEFQVVMKNWSRFCKARQCKCDQCPMNPHGWGKGCNAVLQESPANFEHCIVDWASANPEPRYPTWREWHHTKPRNEQLAPMLLCHFVPCPHDTKYPDDRKCCPCYDNPIPADIAKKLGVEPIKEAR